MHSGPTESTDGIGFMLDPDRSNRSAAGLTSQSEGALNSGQIGQGPLARGELIQGAPSQSLVHFGAWWRRSRIVFSAVISALSETCPTLRLFAAAGASPAHLISPNSTGARYCRINYPLRIVETPTLHTSCTHPRRHCSDCGSYPSRWTYSGHT